MGELVRIGAPEGTQGLGATVDTMGAWITTLSTGNVPIFHPRITNEAGKFRGGMHVCSPYFGPDPSEIGPQHGYARTLEWEVTDHGDRYVVLKNTNYTGEYSGLQHRLGFQIVGVGELKMVIANLSVTNLGPNNIAVAPGLHPYFSGPARDNECQPDAREDTRLARIGDYCTRDVELESGLLIQMTTKNFPEIVVWSDDPDQYHCVEPKSPSLDRHLATTKMLSPRESRSYMLSMKVIDGIKLE